MSEGSGTAHTDPVVRYSRWIVVALALTLISCTYYAIDQRESWNWWLFSWGIGLGITAMLQSELTYRLGRRLRRTSEQGRLIIERRRRLNAFIVAVVGVDVGLVSGAVNSLWYDVLLTLVFGVLWVPATALAYAVLRRRTTTG